MSQDIATYRLEPVGRNLYRMVFGFGRLPPRLEGIEKLAQMVAKMVVTTPGSDVTSPTVGGGVRKLFMEPLDREEVAQVEQSLFMAIDMIEDKILEDQAPEALPSDERLQELRLDEVRYSLDTTSWTLVVRIVSEAGSSFRLDLSNLLLSPSS